MIIESIILEDLGVFAGRQEAHLAPLPGKPVVLFGGLNGGGKTTILEALQLAFYGSKARLASRGNTPYKEYLREAIHRGADVRKGASITVRFSRVTEGQIHRFEVRRSWRIEANLVDEALQVTHDSEFDALLTENWSDYIEGYLPSSIAHLFFFDGEQIKELAEGTHAAEILGTAIHTLLGLDLVDRLEGDLKVLLRRKRSEALSSTATAELARLEEELKLADSEQAQYVSDLGSLTNQSHILAKELRQCEETFQREGGDTYNRRGAIEEELRTLEEAYKLVDARLCALADGFSPLLLLSANLEGLERALVHEGEIRKARLLVDTLAIRDQSLLASLLKQNVPAPQRRKAAEWMEYDRLARQELAGESPQLDASPQLVYQVSHLRGNALQQIQADIVTEIAKLNRLAESIANVQAQLSRVPAADVVARLQSDLILKRAAYQKKATERSEAEMRVEACQRHKERLESRIGHLGIEDIDARFAFEDGNRIIRHAIKVSETLAKLRTAIIHKHAGHLEELILDSFHQLLRKPRLVTALRIDPETFEVTLTGHNGSPLPFSRLSAGERQLLATSLLWGLARASGRPIPTIIDTPLGRLDSSHRDHLVKRYFPVASHQVILLSTDEEIAEEYHEGIRPFVARQYLLSHDDTLSSTTIQPGYFSNHEATN